MTPDRRPVLAALKRFSKAPVVVEIDGMTVEIRRRRPRTLGDLFREAGRWEAETTEGMTQFILESRGAGSSSGPPEP